MRYVGQVYRPPSEAYSLIVQVTYGCSHNKCAFCSMYRDATFRMRPLSEIIKDFHMARQAYRHIDKIFLADGDALIRKAADLEIILDTINTLFPERPRVSCYASPTSLRIRTEAELKSLHAKGLTLLYMGLESGNDEILKRMNKGYTSAELVAMGQKAKACGMALSVTAITGLGGPQYMERHAKDTAAAFSAMRPEYIGLLTLMVHEDTELYQWLQDGSFQLLTQDQVLEETRILVENLDCPGSVFRMNHASNYLALRGTLNQDKGAMLAQIKAAQDHHLGLRPEFWRQL